MKLNPDLKIINNIRRRLKITKGQCPCVPPGQWSADTMCPCKDKREKEICHCKLWVSDSYPQ